MGSEKSTKTGRLAKLTQLENEVAKLSEQLKANKETILLLKQSLAERDLKIHELESKLAYAQQSLLGKATLTIQQCRHQIINGLDGKIINPALSHIQQQIEVIQDIVYEAKDFINKKKLLIQENINATSDRVHQCPDQAIRYFEKFVVEPARLLVNDAVGLVDENVKNSRNLLAHNIIYPSKLWYDKIVVAAQALPTRGRFMFQVWLAEPIMHKLEALPALSNEFSVDAGGLLKSLLGRLKNGAEQGLDNVIEAIKKSPFWDGKRKMGVVQ